MKRKVKTKAFSEHLDTSKVWGDKLNTELAGQHSVQ